VTAFDGSEALARAASAYTGKPVLHMTFDEVRFVSKFDGVWASASLLHLPSDRIDLGLRRLVAALRPGGILYMSFKKGSSEQWRDGRFFADYDDVRADALIRRQPRLEAARIWTLHDVIRPDTLWLNVIARRVSDDIPEPLQI
jgi:SAM-dependent methyltransferase